MTARKKKYEIHDIRNVDKNGFPINDLGKQVPLKDQNGNIILPLNSNLIMSFKENMAISFDPTNKIDVRNGLDNLINILTSTFDESIKGTMEIDLTAEAKKKHNLFTKKPLTIPIVQMYFSWIDNWLSYFTNCYNFEFKLLFYTKFKSKIKNNLIALETNLNNHEIDEKYLLFANTWISKTNEIISMESKINLPKADLQKIAIEEVKQFKQEIQKNNRQPGLNDTDRKFQLKEIAIAFFFRKGKTITTSNYRNIIAKYSESTSDKILQTRIGNIRELTELRGNKTADTKHLNSLNNAKRLLEVEKDVDAIDNIIPVISTFESNYNAQYY